jgi:hypothetical protein
VVIPWYNRQKHSYVRLTYRGFSSSPRGQVTLASPKVGCAAFSTAFSSPSTCPELRILRLGGGNESRDQVTRLADALARCAGGLSGLERLEFLETSRDKDPAVPALADSVKQWRFPRLSRLGLGSYHLLADGLGEAIASSLPSLTDLQISHTYPIEGLAPGMASEAFPRLRRLHLSNASDIRKSTGVALSKALAGRSLAGLEELELSEGQTYQTGDEALGTVLLAFCPPGPASGSGAGTALTTLRLRKCGLGNTAGRCLAKVLQSGGLPALRVLDVKDNEIDDSVLASLVRALETAPAGPQLEELYLGSYRDANAFRSTVSALSYVISKGGLSRLRKLGMTGMDSMDLWWHLASPDACPQLREIDHVSITAAVAAMRRLAGHEWAEEVGLFGPSDASAEHYENGPVFGLRGQLPLSVVRPPGGAVGARLVSVALP